MMLRPVEDDCNIIKEDVKYIIIVEEMINFGCSSGRNCSKGISNGYKNTSEHYFYMKEDRNYFCITKVGSN